MLLTLISGLVHLSEENALSVNSSVQSQFVIHFRRRRQIDVLALSKKGPNKRKTGILGRHEFAFTVSSYISVLPPGELYVWVIDL